MPVYVGVLVSAWVILLCVWDTEVWDTNTVVYGIMEMCLHVYACVKIRCCVIFSCIILLIFSGAFVW